MAAITTAIEVVQILSGLAGAANATAQLVELTRKNATPERLEALKKANPLLHARAVAILTAYTPAPDQPNMEVAREEGVVPFI